ncbi:MAG: tetratricopeptide repeat protein [Acidobacteria bacterium]|nr:tetratricopeptide repeat protein [Acidobacteriota bacterium]
MRRILVAAAGLAWLAGCAKHTATAPTVEPSGGMRATMQRQVRNAQLAGEGDGEIAILRQRLAIAPEAIDVRMQLVEKYEAAGFPDVALEHVRAARGYDQGSEKLLLKEVELLRKLALPGQAAETIDRYLASGRQADAMVLSWHAISLDEAGRLTEGEREHRAAIQRNPGDDALHNNLGYNLYEQQRYAEAAREFEEALKLNRNSELARANLARLMAERPDKPDATGAVAHWTSALGAAAAHNNLAAAYLEKGQYEKAREEIAKALAYKGDYWPALKNLELAAELDGHPAQVRTGAQPTRWQRFAASVKRVFWTTEEAPTRSKGPAMSASR